MAKDVDLSDLMSGAPKAVDLSDLGAKATPGVRAALTRVQKRDRNRRGSDDLTQRLVDAATLGLSSRVNAGLGYLGTATQNLVGKGPGYSAADAYTAERLNDRARQAKLSAEHPILSGSADVVGSLAMPGAEALGKFVVGNVAPRMAEAGLKVPKAVRAAQTARLMGSAGALTGVASGMQAAPGEALKDAEHGAVTGALLAPVAELGGAAVVKAAPVLTRVAKRVVGKGESAMESSSRKIGTILRKAGVNPDVIYSALDEWKANGVSPNFIDIVKTSGALPDVLSVIRKSGPTAEARRLAEKYATDTVRSVRPQVIEQAKALPTGETRTPTQIRADLAALNESAATKASARKAEIARRAETKALTLDKSAAQATTDIDTTLDAATAAKAAREATGERVQSAAAKWAADMQAKGAALITEAEAKAAGIKLPVADTQDYLTKQIELLGRNPEANKVKIGLLSKWKSDLENSIGDLPTLRDLKSSIYEMKAPEGLEAGPMAKLRADFSHALDADIRKGLDAAGEATPAAREALDLYDQANKVFTERYDTMESSLGKLLGKSVKRDETDPANVVYTAKQAPEAAAETLRKLASDDHRAFQTVMDVLDPETRVLAQEQVVSSLGRDSKGVVDPVKFVAEVKALPTKSRELLFGSETPETAADRALAAKGDLAETSAARKTVVENNAADRAAKVDEALAAETADPAAQEAALATGEGVLTKPSEEYAPAVAAMDTAHTPVHAAGAKQALVNALENGDVEAGITGLTSPKVTQNLTTSFGEEPVTALQAKAKALSEQGGNARDLAGTTGVKDPEIDPLVESITAYDLIDPRRGMVNATLRLLGKNDRLSPKEVDALIARLTQNGSAGVSDVLPRLIKKYSKTPLGVAPFLTRPAAQTPGDDLDALKETYGIE